MFDFMSLHPVVQLIILVSVCCVMCLIILKL